MARDKRPEAGDLTHLDALAANPRAYHLFQALRIVEAAHMDRPRLGRSRRPVQDAVRIGQQVELAFPPVTISAFEPGGAAPRELPGETPPEERDVETDASADDTKGEAAVAPPGPEGSVPRAGPARLRNLFFGLFGPMGPLPIHLTEYARDRARNH
ncbi:MAG: type VI secretion system baseplate subunit TssG, partial [Pseudomonadota bacterium]